MALFNTADDVDAVADKVDDGATDGGQSPDS